MKRFFKLKNSWKIAKSSHFERAHIVFPYHVLLDEYEEERLEDKKFGSTKRGIAPVYSDKYMKTGVQAADLLNKDYLAERIRSNLSFKIKL